MLHGINLGWTNYYQSDQKFTDLLEAAGVMKPYPMAQWIAATEGYVKPGTYCLSAAGKGKVSLIGPDLVFDGPPKSYPIEIKPEWSRGKRLLVRVTQSDPADPICDVRLCPEGIDPDAQPFHPDFLAKLRGAWALRSVHFYDIDQSRADVETDWSTALPWLWKRFAELCSAVQARPYLNLPHKCPTTDYAEELGKLFARHLSPGLVPLVAYSNEIWNNVPPWVGHGNWVLENGPKLAGTGAKYKAQARFSRLIWEGFERGFGSPIERVLEGQHMGEGTITAGLDQAREDGFPVDGIASAPYIYPGEIPWDVIEPMWDAAASLDATAPDQAAKIREAACRLVTDTMIPAYLSGSVPKMAAWSEIARKYCVKLYAYECGQHFQIGTRWLTPVRDEVIAASNRTQAMADVIREALSLMSKYYAAANYYEFCRPFGGGSGQAFGAIEYLADDTPKFRVWRDFVDRFNSSDPRPVAGVIAPPIGPKVPAA